MRRIDLLKFLVMRHIQDNRPLITNACHNEMECFKLYLEQVKSQYEALSTERLRMAVKSYQIDAA